MKRINLVSLIRRPLLFLTAGLWIEEGFETIWPPRWLNAGRDWYLDSLTIVLSVLMIAWVAARCIIQANEQQMQAHKQEMTALASIVDASSERAGLAGKGRILQAVGGRKG